MEFLFGFPGTLEFLTDVESNILILEVAPNNFVNPKPSPLTPGDEFSFSSFFLQKGTFSMCKSTWLEFFKMGFNNQSLLFVGLPILACILCQVKSRFVIPRKKAEMKERHHKKKCAEQRRGEMGKGIGGSRSLFLTKISILSAPCGWEQNYVNLFPAYYSPQHSRCDCVKPGPGSVSRSNHFEA